MPRAGEPVIRNLRPIGYEKHFSLHSTKGRFLPFSSNDFRPMHSSNLVCDRKFGQMWISTDKWASEQRLPESVRGSEHLACVDWMPRG
jgi:hypothetical protein